MYGGRALIVLLEGVVLAGQDGVEQDAHDGGDSQTRQGHDADLDAAGVGVPKTIRSPAGIIVPTMAPILETLPTHPSPFSEIKVATQ